MKKLVTVFSSIIVIAVLLAGVVMVKPAQAYSGYPTFDIAQVIKDKKVTIQTHNLPANKTFTVRMGKFGTLAIGGVVVGKLQSGKGGAMQATFTIPASLKGLSRIAIRMDSNTGGYYAYNWFDNVSPTGGPTTTPTPTVIPTFTISAVKEDTSVTILTKNFPAGKTWKVLIGKYGTLGVGGVEVKQFKSVDGGSFTKTFQIPAKFKGETRLAIRLVSTTGGFFAYNWFWNNDAP